jgi:hypothetical protein
MVCPEHTSYNCSIFCRVLALAFEALISTSESSANKRWLKLGASLHTRTPSRLPSRSALFNNEEKPSAQIRKRYGEIGSPCLKPRCGVITSVHDPFTLNWYLTDVIHLMIRFIHLSSKPNLLIIASKKFHSTRSYALLMSNLIAAYPSLPLLLFFM